MSKFLEVYGARTHNLKNINVKIPKNKMVIITGLSGSGKSSLAFNTIYSIGQQKYLESLSSYARMFVWWMKEEAEVDEIVWLSPTISIDQKTTNRNPRSTVGTITEIYDYYKLLYLNIWDRKCVECDSIIKKDSLTDIIRYISSFDIDTKFILKAPLFTQRKELDFETIKKEVLDLWFIRFWVTEKWKQSVVYTVNDDVKLSPAKMYDVDIIVDRLVVKDYSDRDSADTKRLKDSLELAFNSWKWKISVEMMQDTWSKHQTFSNIFVCSECGHVPEELNISSFSFNSHSWACSGCQWLGVKMVFLEENIVNPNLSLEEWAILPPGFWNYFLSLIKQVGQKYNIRTDVAYKHLTADERKKVMHGTGWEMFRVNFVNESGRSNTYNSRFEGVINTLTRRYFEGSSDKVHYNNYITSISCPDCNWQRLKSESLSVYLNETNIWTLSDMSVTDSIAFLKTLILTENQKKIAEKVLKNIIERLEFLAGVWLDYMTLSRKANTLSGWEAQRIRLATQIGVKLEGIIYVLDEPSIGLHPRDNEMLIKNLKKLRDIWNTLIVVEHDEDIMRQSDYIIDIWPWAGIHGWEVVAEWTLEEIVKNPKSITAPYLSWEMKVEIEKKERKIEKYLEIHGATQHNLKNIDVKIPVGNLTVVTWVSGSGKSSLINDILSNYLANTLNRASREVGAHREIKWVEVFDKVLTIDQSPIWKTPRSNPATYTWVFTHIREVFAESYDAKLRWYAPGRFSFNTKSGRCQECEWDGVKKIEMHFLPPVYTHCESCGGRRFNSETLEIKYKWKTISDVLNFTVEEAHSFFTNHPKISKILKVLEDVWLNYIKLGQPSTTLSGWEAQRIKLATELSKRSTSKTIYILDEPTTGLHFQDVEKLLKILHHLVDKWNTVVVIEHNMNVIINADHIIDIGPTGWDKWWTVVVEWDVDTVRKHKKSFTGQAIEQYINW